MLMLILILGIIALKAQLLMMVAVQTIVAALALPVEFRPQAMEVVLFVGNAQILILPVSIIVMTLGILVARPVELALAARSGPVPYKSQLSVITAMDAQGHAPGAKTLHATTATGCMKGLARTSG